MTRKADTKLLRNDPPGAELVSRVGTVRQHFGREVDEIRRELGGNLTWQNLRSQLISVTFPGGGGAVTFDPGLRQPPEVWIPNPHAQMTIWATDTDRTTWTGTSMTLRSDSAGKATLLVM